MNLTGGNLSKVGGTLRGAPLDLAVDPVNQVLYYTTSSATQTADTIQRVLYNGAMNSVLFTATGPGATASSAAPRWIWIWRMPGSIFRMPAATRFGVCHWRAAARPWSKTR